MINWNRAVSLILTIVASSMLTTPVAWAHSFNVALIIPDTPEGRDIRDGFMLATTERDSHPDEHSDGHLGGLDVYVTVIEVTGQKAGDIGQLVRQGQIEIVAPFGSGEMLSEIIKILEGRGVVLLSPGTTPFSRPDLPGVAAFLSAYEKAYGTSPSPEAAEGYNAARRIDQAVRPLEGVDDLEALRRSFTETRHEMTW